MYIVVIILCVCIYIYIYTYYMCICICVYIYIYINTVPDQEELQRELAGGLGAPKLSSANDIT